MKRLFLASFLSAMILGSSNALAVSGQTNVTLEFPDLIILHYISDLTLVFTAAADIADDEGSASLSQPLSDSASGSVIFNANISPNSSGSVADSFDVAVENVWAVRGITASGTITVKATLNSANATLTSGTTTSTAVASNLRVLDSSGTEYAGSTGYQFNAPGFSLLGAEVGGIVFALDIKQVVLSGQHTGMQYTIDAVSP